MSDELEAHEVDGPPRYVITPRLIGHPDMRLILEVSYGDYVKIRPKKRGYHGTVTDLKTGTRYRVWGASCGIPTCFCDGIAKPVESRKRLP